MNGASGRAAPFHGRSPVGGWRAKRANWTPSTSPRYWSGWLTPPAGHNPHDPAMFAALVTVYLHNSR